jgi:hypothetical protein
MKLVQSCMRDLFAQDLRLSPLILIWSELAAHFPSGKNGEFGPAVERTGLQL